MNSGPSGFYNAPVTKVLCVGCGVLSLLAGTRGANIFGLSYQGIFQELELWRLLTSNFIFSSTPEILFGLYLLYFFRVFERQLGSNKFAAFALITTFIATSLEVSLVCILKGGILQDTRGPVPGPYGLIFASFVPFFFDIPLSTRFTVVGLKFSDKSFVYLGGLQLLLSSWTRSLMPGLCGILAGFTYRSNILGVRRLKFPDAVVAIASQVFSPIISRSPPSVGGGSANQGANNGQQPPRGGARPPPPPPGATMNRFGASVPALAPLPPPSEAAVSTLEAMGFDRTLALRALSQARNDLELATNLLIESQIQ
eukprot:TRINITY_DN2198_c0_g1_i1.p1 TRINITY_DN2198_c0_g1~~TRINITY_DN2198_c0_g1_i1.p1  ORF type:complete len:312 (+),score=26.38 TRINITY_DN2198_c0_g1_i1:334-1269(+)